MLGAYTHEATHVIQVLLEHIVAVDCGMTRTRSQHSCQHRDGRGLTRTVVTEQSKDLALVHANVDAINGTQPVAERLPQILYLQEFILTLKVELSNVGRLKVITIHILGLEIFIDLILLFLKDELLGRKCASSCLKSVLLVFLAHFDDALAITPTAQVEAVPIGGRQPVTWIKPMALSAGCPRHDVVYVYAKE